MGCDETGLRRTFRLEYGVSPREYHQRLRVQRGLGLMLEGTAKTSAIARAVGYASESHFLRSGASADRKDTRGAPRYRAR